MSHTPTETVEHLIRARLAAALGGWRGSAEAAVPTVAFVATWLIDITGEPIAPAVYLSVIAIGAFCATLMMPETSGRRLGVGVDEEAITASIPKVAKPAATTAGRPE